MTLRITGTPNSREKSRAVLLALRPRSLANANSGRRCSAPATTTMPITTSTRRAVSAARAGMTDRAARRPVATWSNTELRLVDRVVPEFESLPAAVSALRPLRSTAMSSRCTRSTRSGTSISLVTGSDFATRSLKPSPATSESAAR